MLETHRMQLERTQKADETRLTNEAEFITSEVTRTVQQVKEEAQKLSADVQLDVNLERKRRETARNELSVKRMQAVSELVARAAARMQSELDVVSMRITSSISAIAAATIVIFVLYESSK